MLSIVNTKVDPILYFGQCSNTYPLCKLTNSLIGVVKYISVYARKLSFLWRIMHEKRMGLYEKGISGEIFFWTFVQIFFFLSIVLSTNLRKQTTSFLVLPFDCFKR